MLGGEDSDVTLDVAGRSVPGAGECATGGREGSCPPALLPPNSAPRPRPSAGFDMTHSRNGRGIEAKAKFPVRHVFLKWVRDNWKKGLSLGASSGSLHAFPDSR